MSADNRERDELAVLVAECLDMNDPEAGTLEPVRADFDLADAILAAGFRRTPEATDEWEYAVRKPHEDWFYPAGTSLQELAEVRAELEEEGLYDRSYWKRRAPDEPWIYIPSHPDTETPE